MVSENKLLLWGVIIFMLSSVSCLYSQQKTGELKPPKFYKGPIAIQGVTGKIALQPDETPNFEIEALVQNTGQNREQAIIGFRGAKRVQLSLDKQESQKIKLIPAASWSGNQQGAQKVTTDLLLEINEMPVSKPIARVELYVTLPQRVPALIRSNMQLKEDTAGDQTVYLLARQHFYLTELNLVYTLGKVTLHLEKRMRPETIDKPGPVSFKLDVVNLGPGEARNVVLNDNFDPRDFEGEGEGFELYAGRENDRRLLWSTTIKQIPARGRVTVEYTVNAKFAVHSTSLNAATATINNQLVGVSNKIKLAQHP